MAVWLISIKRTCISAIVRPQISFSPKPISVQNTELTFRKRPLSEHTIAAAIELIASGFEENVNRIYDASLDEMMVIISTGSAASIRRALSQSFLRSN
jgi:hypothetical protein